MEVATCSGSSSTASIDRDGRRGSRNSATTRCGPWWHSSRHARLDANHIARWRSAASRAAPQDRPGGYRGVRRIGRCGRRLRACHGADQRRPWPAIWSYSAGAARGVLQAALHAYAQGTRRSGIMEPIAAELKPDSIAKLADYDPTLDASFLVLPPLRWQKRGRRSRRSGDSNARFLACVPYHAGAPADVSRLAAGRNAAYRATRLRLWKKPAWSRRPISSDVMAPIARLLSDQQIDEVSLISRQFVQANQRRREAMRVCPGPFAAAGLLLWQAAGMEDSVLSPHGLQAADRAHSSVLFAGGGAILLIVVAAELDRNRRARG